MDEGHSGVAENDEADDRAKKEMWMGERMHWPDIVTLAGVRQAFPLPARVLLCVESLFFPPAPFVVNFNCAMFVLFVRLFSLGFFFRGWICPAVERVPCRVSIRGCSPSP